MEINPSSNPLLQLGIGSNNKLQFIGIFHYLLVLLWLIYVYSLLLAPILIERAYAILTYTQFKMIGKQSYGNDCSS